MFNITSVAVAVAMAFAAAAGLDRVPGAHRSPLRLFEPRLEQAGRPGRRAACRAHPDLVRRRRQPVPGRRGPIDDLLVAFALETPPPAANAPAPASCPMPSSSRCR